MGAYKLMIRQGCVACRSRHHDSLGPSAGHLTLALALVLPLLATSVGAALGLLLNLLFPRLSQPGAGALAGNGGGRVNLAAMLPGFGALPAMAIARDPLGPTRPLLYAGLVTVLTRRAA
ncbi:hypothetical protein ABZ904_24865 [Streptomyces sp. NPDC046900]|uniref:hypothetical protein n=1 Tax=Streptomyces sp. NPDC046900 TaxID=3155473 RepID=UPI0034024CF2